MSERDDGSTIPEARRRRTRWPGWVWLIPLVALGFAGWLAFEEWVIGPRPLTVHFADVSGIKPGAPVRHKGVQVGSVDRIRLDDDLGGATLVLDMTALKGHLGEGTRVWIVRPSLSPEALGNIISGAYLAIEPDGGDGVKELVGLESPPIIEPEGPGRIFVLIDEEAGGLSRGAPVHFRGIAVGEVLGTRFGEDGAVEIPVFVRGEYAELVREASVFWRAGGFAVETGGAGIDLDLPSLGAIATGAVAFDTPGVLEGPAAEPRAEFVLWQNRDHAATARSGPRFAYSITFAEPVGDLAAGAPVTLAGKQIGRVVGTGLEVAPDGRGLITPVTIVIDARRMEMELATAASREAVREQLDAIIERLASVGMRARVAEGGIVFGARSIELVILPDAGPAGLDRSGELPRIPAENEVRTGGAPAPAEGGAAAPGSGQAPAGDGRGAGSQPSADQADTGESGAASAPGAD